MRQHQDPKSENGYFTNSEYVIWGITGGRSVNVWDVDPAGTSLCLLLKAEDHSPPVALVGSTIMNQ